MDIEHTQQFCLLGSNMGKLCNLRDGWQPCMHCHSNFGELTSGDVFMNTNETIFYLHITFPAPLSLCLVLSIVQTLHKTVTKTNLMIQKQD